jgi:hypothetical protein
MLGNSPWVARVRLRGDPARIPSKNFLANHQLDIHLCTEFPYTFCRQYCPQRLMCIKRADT